MNKKELRKQLELTLVKTIEEVLNKNNSDATKKIRKTTYEASKNVAKKFYKTLKAEVKPSIKNSSKKSEVTKTSKPAVKRTKIAAKRKK